MTRIGLIFADLFLSQLQSREDAKSSLDLFVTPLNWDKFALKKIIQ